MSRYIHQLKEWPRFTWDEERLMATLAEVRHKQGRLLGKMKGLGFDLQNEATLKTLTLDVIKSSEIEGELLNSDQVRSSIARRLGLDVGGLIHSDRDVEGVVEMMLDATQNYTDSLTEDRLYGWHAALFPSGRSGTHKIVVGGWRDNLKDDPMQVVSGHLGRTVHFQAPDSDLLADEMMAFLQWLKENEKTDAVIKAAVAHLWFVTLHPFDDGNGRIARAIADMQLANSDDSSQRFYSMSAQIRIERNAYYNTLEKAQKDTLDISDWIEWFLNCLNRSIAAADETLASVLQKSNFWKNNMESSFNARQKLMLNKLLDGNFEGKLTSSKWAKLAKCSSDTAVRDINDLLNRDILSKEAAGGRSTSYKILYPLET